MMGPSKRSTMHAFTTHMHVFELFERMMTHKHCKPVQTIDSPLTSQSVVIQSTICPPLGILEW